MFRARVSHHTKPPLGRKMTDITFIIPCSSKQTLRTQELKCIQNMLVSMIIKKKPSLFGLHYEIESAIPQLPLLGLVCNSPISCTELKGRGV